MKKRFKAMGREEAGGILAFGERLDNMSAKERKKEFDKFKKGLAKADRKTLEVSVKEAHRTGFMTKEEYERDWKGKYLDKDGIDGISTVLYVAVFGKKIKRKKVVVTTNDDVLKDRKKIKKRFGITLMSPLQATKRMEREEVNQYKEAMQTRHLNGGINN